MLQWAAGAGAALTCGLSAERHSLTPRFRNRLRGPLPVQKRNVIDGVEKASVPPHPGQASMTTGSGTASVVVLPRGGAAQGAQRGSRRAWLGDTVSCGRASQVSDSRSRIPLRPMSSSALRPVEICARATIDRQRLTEQFF